MTIVCPACGGLSWEPVLPFQLSPGRLEWTCPQCETAFVVHIDFYPREDE